MHRIWLCIFLVTVEQNIFVQSEVFTSITHITQLLGTEIELAKQLKVYLEREHERLNRVQKFLNVINDELSQAQGKEEQYFGNPINVFVFMRHLTAEWYHIKEMPSPDLKKIMDSNWLFPSAEDFIGTITSLLRLQNTYQLTTSQMVNGEISSNHRSQKLTSRECYDIGHVAYANKDFYYTSIWMQEALDRFDEENDRGSISRIDILDHLINATFQEGNIEKALALTEEILAIDSNHVQAKANKIYYKSLIKNQKLKKDQRKDHFDTLEENNSSHTKNFRVKEQRQDNKLTPAEVYKALCRQNHSQLSHRRQAKLFCQYRHNNHPYLILRPVKEEQVFDEPIILLFHDVVSNTDIEKMKELAIPQLERAFVGGSANNIGTAAGYRISKRAWLQDKDSPAVARLSRLIGAVTNLTMETAEPYQIINYGVGGHYLPHVDFFTVSGNTTFESEYGNRIATWLTYLSDVELGGATIFPVVGGHIMPKKGTAVFWCNMHASGEVDYRTAHAACPVLVGNKWVANKLMHERGQEFRRRCSLDPKL